jgi:hypothetical protein
MKKIAMFALLTLGLQATAFAGAENAITPAGTLDCTVTVGADKVEFVGELQKMTTEFKTGANSSVAFRSSKIQQASVLVKTTDGKAVAIGGNIDSNSNKLSIEQDGVKLECAVTR